MMRIKINYIHGQQPSLHEFYLPKKNVLEYNFFLSNFLLFEYVHIYFNYINKFLSFIYFHGIYVITNNGYIKKYVNLTRSF